MRINIDPMAVIAGSVVGIGLGTAGNADVPSWATLTMVCVASGTLAYCLSRRGK